MTPYPAIYVPPGISVPACNPHRGCTNIFEGHGPDGLGGGKLYPGPFNPNDGTAWAKTRAGWWLGLNGHLPQNTARLQPNPRVLQWRVVIGAIPEHEWRVPVILELAEEGSESFYVSALDRIWNGEDWQVTGELADMQDKVAAVATGAPLHEDLEERNKIFRELAVGLLSVGHWIDMDFLCASGWLSERLMLNVVEASFRQPEVAGV